MKNKGVVSSQNKFHWVYLIGFFLILALPLLSLPPWFSPPDWGKTIIFRSILSVLIFIFLYQILNGRERFSAKFSKSVKICLFLLLALFGIFLLATVFSLDRNFSLWGSPYRSGGFLNFAFYIFFAILVFLILRKSDWQKIWDFSILIGILVSIIAIFQWQGLFKEIFITYEFRPPSTIGGPIFLAIYLLLLSFSTLSFGIKEKRVPKKVFYLGSLFLFIFIILLTYTRAAFFGLAVGLLYFLLLYPRRLILLKGFTLCFLILGFYGIYYVNTQPELPQFLKENKILRGVISRLSIKAALRDPRISGWKVSWQALKERPILGYGPENFSIGFDKFYDPSLPGIEKMPGGITSWWDRAHNFIFDISISAGIPALIIYLLLFGVLFWQLQKLKKENPEQSLIAHGTQTTLLAYLVANFFSFDTFSSYLISFLLIGYSLHLISSSNFTREAESRTENFPRTVLGKLRRYRGIILFLLFILLVWFIWGFNLKPLQINKEKNLAGLYSEKKLCQEALEKMENVLASNGFLDPYLRLEYRDIIADCIEENRERAFELAERATEILKENTKIRPYYTRNWILLGGYTNILIEGGEKDLKEEANYYFEKANELSPKRQEVFIGWIKTDLISGEYQKAEEKAKKCIDLNEKLGDCWWLMGLSNIYLGEFKTGKENIEIARKKGYPINSELSLLEMAKTYIQTENYPELIKIYQKLIKIKPENPKYHIGLAVFYKEIGEFEKAKKEAIKILELFPEYEEEVKLFLKELP